MNLVSAFNQLLSVLILFFWSFVPLHYQQSMVHKVATPSAELKNASYPAIVAIPTPKTSVVPVQSVVKGSQPVPWGTTEKVGEHEYRTYVANDPAMGTPGEILAALNLYRKNHGAGSVRDDENICKLARWRAQEQQKAGNLDSHKGLVDYMNDQKHWQELDVKAIGENASYGYILSGTHLIEWVFDSDAEHRDNQLNPQWNLTCAGISGVTVDLIFGTR